MSRSGDLFDRCLPSKKEDGCKPSTLQQYRWVARATLDVLAHAGRPADPRKWAAADARWLLQRFQHDQGRISIVTSLTRFAGNSVFSKVRAPRRNRTGDSRELRKSGAVAGSRSAVETRGPPLERDHDRGSRERRHRTRGPSSDQLRALLGIDEGSRRPKLVVLLGLDRGPGEVEWLQLPAEYIDLAGNRRLLRTRRPRSPILVDLGEPRKVRAKELLRDDRVKRWHEGNRLENRKTAPRRLHDLSQLLDALGLSVEQAIELGRDEPERLEVLLYQWAEKRKKEGRQVSSLRNLVVPLRTLFEKERVPFYAWPKLKRRGAPTLVSERVPSSRELQLICAQLEPRWRAAALLMAHAGLRPGVLCGDNTRVDFKALQLKHLPDLILKPRRRFERIPFRIDVPAELNKTGQSYITFGGQEVADALLAYFNDRVQPIFDRNRQVVKRHRERLTPESYVIAGKLAGKRRAHAGHPVEVAVLSTAIRKGILKVQPEGVRWRSYVLRDYFSTRLLLAEIRGLFKRDIREYLLGHDTGASGRYTVGKRLPDELIEEMRSMYASALPFLETPRTIRDAEDEHRKGRNSVEPLPGGVLTAKEREQFPGITDAEFVDELSRGLRDGGEETPRQQVVPVAEARRLMRQGWRFVSRFGPGEVVVRSP